MTERISLEVPATLSALATVRRVLGGLGARLGYSLDDIEDLCLGTEELLRAALAHELPGCFQIEVLVAADHLRLTIGTFCSEGLRAEVAAKVQACDNIDLCTLLRRTMDEVGLAGTNDSFTVTLVRRHSDVET